MRVLITNDDGVRSRGLAILREALRQEHDLWIVAPHVERSGTSHAITLRGAVKLRQLEDQVYSCDGTPADCVLYANLGAIPIRPDIVVSGINHGPNIGTDIIYSGTVGAARQAALMGYPAIAVSVVDTSTTKGFEFAANFVRENLEQMRLLWSTEHFWNINIPGKDGHDGEVSITFPAKRRYNDRLVQFGVPNGDRYLFLDGEPSDANLEPGSDWEAVVRRRVSVSPIYLHPHNHREVKETEAGDFTATVPTS